jgi:hypothetical protein
MLAILRQRNFALLWLGGLISFVGDWVLFSALTMLGGQAAASLLGDRVGLVPVLNWMGIMYLLAGVCALALLRGPGARWRCCAGQARAGMCRWLNR